MNEKEITKFISAGESEKRELKTSFDWEAIKKFRYYGERYAFEEALMGRKGRLTGIIDAKDGYIDTPKM